MIGRIRYAQWAAGVLAGFGVCVAGGELHAQEATAPAPGAATSITVKSMTSQIYKAPDQAALPKQREGAGAMDAAGTVVQIAGEQAVFYTFTQSRPKPGANRQDMQGAFGVSKIAADGSLAPVVPLTEQARRIGNNRERNFMKPQVTTAGQLPNGDTANVVTVISTEQNGDNANLGDLTGLKAQDVINQSNGNPQIVALVQDPATGKLKKEYNLITLLLKSIGQNNDQQQWGTPELVETGNGLIGISAQRNNQTCWFGVLQVNADGTIDAKGLVKNENQCQHGKPTASVLPGSETANGVTFVTAHVRANNQPADIGVAVDLITFDGTTGKTAVKKSASKLIAKSEIVDNNDMRKNKYATQPTAAVFKGATGPIIAVTYAMANPAKANKTNGHAGASNITNVITLDKALAELDHKDTGTVLLGGARHARGWASEYGQLAAGATAGDPAIAILAGSSLGAGAAGMNMITFDKATGKMNAVTNDKVFTIANNSDIAGLPTMGKTNPQDQAGAFLTLVKGNLKNTSTKYPEVKKFSVALVNGPEDPAKSTRDSLYLSLPQAWAANVVVSPGGAAPAVEVPAGPTPASVPVDVSHPADPSNGDPSVGGVGGSGSAGGGEVSTPETSAGGASYGRNSADSGGCSVSTSSTNHGGEGALALLGLGLALASVRRSKKEQ